MLDGSSGQTEGQSKEPISFELEIQLMMFGLGDSPTPLSTTANIIENIVLQQMRSFLELLEDVATKRGSETITPNDILFLLRKDKHKLKRIINYICIKESKVSLKAAMTNPNFVHGTQDDLLPLRNSREKFKQASLDFLKSIGITNVFDSNELDVVKKERDVRAYQSAMSMSEGSYFTYAESRKTSFAGANFSSARFLEWIRTRYYEFPVNKIKPVAADMLIYLAKETVAQLVDLALLVRQDNNVTPGDPYSRAQQAGNLPYDSYGPAQRQIEGPPPIHPNEIREVLRRYWSTQSNPWGAFTVDINCYTYQRLLTVYNTQS